MHKILILSAIQNENYMRVFFEKIFFGYFGAVAVLHILKAIFTY